MGDIIRTLPAVALLRETWPQAEIGWAIERHVAPLLADHPWVDRLFVVDRDRIKRDARRLRPSALRRVREFSRVLRDFAPDLALDFQGCFKSGLTAWLSRAPVRVSFGRSWVRERSEIFATHRATLPDESRHRVERALTLARAAGATTGEPRVDLALSPQERARGRRAFAQLSGGRDCIAIAPFSSGRQSWKRYPLDRWCEVARELARASKTVLVLAGPGEEVEARELARRAGSGVRTAEAFPLRTLAALLEECSVLIGGDTGPMHMAWGVGTSVVAIYGPTDPVLNSPWGEGHATVMPARRTGRTDMDRFPGVTPARIVEAALERVRARRRHEPVTSTS